MVDRISWWGPLDSFSGYGAQGLNTILALDKLGVKVRIGQYKIGIVQRDVPKRFLQLLDQPWDWFEAPWSVIHTVVDAMRDVWHEVPHWDHHTRKLAWRSMWEWTTLPRNHSTGCLQLPYYNWADLLNRFADIVVVPAQQQAQLFRDGGVERPIFVVHDGVDPIFQYTPPPAFTRDGEFRWLVWGVLNSRKCPVETVEVFQRAFPPAEYPQLRLHLKTMGKQFEYGLWGMAYARQIEAADPRIRVTNAVWTRQELLAEIARSHACICLSRGEGAGNPPMQAMAIGRPVVLSNHSGLTEITNPDWNYPVEPAGTEVYPSPDCTGGVVYERCLNNLAHAEAQLRAVYQDYPTACARAARGGEVMRTDYTFAHTARQLLAAMETHDGR